MQYAKQREIMQNIDKKLDYHNLQKDRHPYINDLRAFMQRKKSNHSNDYDSAQKSQANNGNSDAADVNPSGDVDTFLKKMRFSTSSKDANMQL